MSTPDDLGPLVRLWGIRAQDLPSPAAAADELAPLLASILKEAIPFIDSAAPKSANAATAPANKLWKPKGSKSHPDSASRVEVSERVVPARDLEAAATAAGDAKDGKKKMKKKSRIGPETWCCRRSVHEDAPRRGTASWAEFERCFRDEHAESERRFTPSVAGAREARRWRSGLAGLEVEVEAEAGLGLGLGRRWGRFGLAVVEMRHKIGRPVLRDRTFPVLQMTCSRLHGEEEEEEEEEGEEFLVVSIPVPDFGSVDAGALAAEKDAMVALYVSVERVRKMPGGGIEWLMATASDAGGALPMWVQTVAAPGVIWKDVPLFLGWIAGERDRGEDKGKGKGRDQGGG